ncbi:MAG TPA: hypothetical protein VG992_02090 [Candidatus Saccharimonadales bacterium]|nr:hypothetical protein [Candidatus Saccharimonadales bacterium]
MTAHKNTAKKRSYTTRKQANDRRWPTFLILALLVAAVGVVVTLHPFRNDADKTANEAGTQTSGNATDDTKKLSNNSGRAIGGATDTQGQAAATTPRSQWTTSASGVITVESPGNGSTLTSGNNISGMAAVSTVHFRLIDDQVGVIAQGSLKVINGSFSGKLSFGSHASTGRLDIFSTTHDGVEQNEVHISVKF